MSGTEAVAVATMDLSRPGVVWLDASAVSLELTGAGRPVARLVTGGAGRTGPLLEVGGRPRKDASGAIDRWYRREARERIGAVTAVEADRLGLVPGRITIRDQRTRWGSCSTSGTLSFNWRLVIGPGHALRYVVIHELIHIRHHNHSKAFWSALTEALPDWKRSASWLRANEKKLTAYRPVI
jgi:antitoxin (DNA-binding transcriptional repressor) of toxin-antitoxin stability system